MTPLEQKMLEEATARHESDKVYLRVELKAARAEIERLTMALAEVEALEMQHGAVIERLTKERDHDALTREGILQKRINDLLARAEKAEAERDIHKKLLRSCLKGNNSLREKAQNYKSERDNAYSLLADAYGAGTGDSVIEAHLADAERDMRQRAANTAKEYCDNGYEHIVHNAILALPLKHGKENV